MDLVLSGLACLLRIHLDDEHALLESAVLLTWMEWHQLAYRDDFWELSFVGLGCF